MNKNKLTIEEIKLMGKKKSKENLEKLLKLFDDVSEIDLKREIVSSIGRQTFNENIYNFIKKEAFNGKNPMELVYQMYRTCLYKGKMDEKFKILGEKILEKYKNENLYKMKRFYEYKQSKRTTNRIDTIKEPLLIVGNSKETMKKLMSNSVDMIFTSPPYYNAKEYSDYNSYEEYLLKMKAILKECYRVLDDGRFIIINVSPVITRRAGREFESIRYPIPYDFHQILKESGFYFIDEIQWIKPEPSVPNRIGGYMQTKRPLTYKPNCITETIMVYRKNCDFLIDKNVAKYKDYDKFLNKKVDTTNCWFIAPKSDKNHPAVFPEELCEKVLRYYSFENDVVLDPFAGSGTLGRVAFKMRRIPVMCEKNEKYAEIIKQKSSFEYIVKNL